MPLLDLAMVILGLIILLAAGDFLVKGAVNLALRLGIPAFIVSLTVVAFGTSAPELLISVKAVLEDAPGIAGQCCGLKYCQCTDGAWCARAIFWASDR